SDAQTHHMVARHSYGVSHTGVSGTRDRMDHTIFCDVALCGAIAVFECAVDQQVSPLVGGGQNQGTEGTVSPSSAAQTHHMVAVFGFLRHLVRRGRPRLYVVDSAPLPGR